MTEATPSRAHQRIPRRWILLGVALAAALSLLHPTVRLVAGTIAQAPRAVVQIGGFGAPRSFLIIGQNADEPRPTGGFMGSMGLLTTHNGGVDAFDYRNSLDFEDSRAPRVIPPAALDRYAGLGAWQMRDANWSPDFPTSMAQIDWFWQRDQGVRLDGAVAFTEEALAILLRATGPVVIPDTGETVAAEDVRRWIAWQVYPLGKDGRPVYEPGAKTRILSLLGDAVLRRLRRPRLTDLGPYLAAATQLVQEKHVMLWFRDPALEGLARGWGIDGGLRQPDGDYLAVIDSSVTLNKIGRYVGSQVDYVVEPRPAEGIARARVTVAYENQYDPVEARRYYPPFYLSRLYNPRIDRFEDVEGLWATWLRLYVPDGAVLRGASGVDEYPTIEHELGKTVFGAYVSIGIGERRRLTFEYDVPYRPDLSGAYALFLQRQPGVVRTYRVSLTQANAGGPPGTTTDLGPLDRDRSLGLKLAP